MQAIEMQRQLLASMISEHGIEDFIAWYYTPMARPLTSNLTPRVTVYDCMDELSAFKGAPQAMREHERHLFTEADLVFTGGASLYESKRKQHASVHLFPSSVDTAHFAQARRAPSEPEDQAHLPHPRVGYAGVIDERMDLELLGKAATLRPDWQFVMLGPVVKIDPDSLPKAANIHYLGMKTYSELPAYFSGWEIGMLPFAMNESTRFISPTKTPEYLAAGLQVVSTPIRDVATTYGDLGFVKIAGNADEFVRAVDFMLEHAPTSEVWARVDQFLAKSSWDKTWSEMNRLIEEKLALKTLAAGSGRMMERAKAAAGGTNV